jgi:hypothetical protein
MAARYLAGRAVVFTASGTVAYSGVATVATSQNEVQNVSLTDEFDLIEVRNRAGQTVTQAAINVRQRLTVEITPHAITSDNTQAAAATAIELPTPLSQVTLASFEAAEFNGTWNYLGGGALGISNAGVVTLTLPLGRPDGAALTPVTIT